MIPLWLMIAQGVKQVADNQNNQIDNFNRNQQYTPNGQPVDMTGNSNSGLGNAFSTFSSIYGNYLDDEKKRKLFQQ